MACETPVLATNVGGIPELVRDGQNGFLVPAKDSVKLAERLLDLLKNERLRMQMGKIGRKMIFKMGLSWEQCAEQIRSIYQQAVDSDQ
jgi:glycosyltransferase involved in cell wall biosynthesis